MRVSSTTGRIAAAGLVLSPLLYAVTRFTWPHDSDASTTRQVAAAAAHPSAWYVSGMLEGLSGLAALVGALCFTLLVTGRGAVLARIGLGLAACSAIGFVVNWTVNTVLVAQATRLPLDRAVAAYEPALHSGYMAPFVVFLILSPFWGLFVVLSAARHGLVPWWVVGVFVVGGIGGAVFSQATPVATVPLVLEAAGLGLVARNLVTAPIVPSAVPIAA